MARVDKDSIERLASAVFDNQRRGMPKPGCDCVQCFGYCMIDGDEALRKGTLAANGSHGRTGPADGAALNFE